MIIIDRNRKLPWVYLAKCSEILYDCTLIDLIFKKVIKIKFPNSFEVQNLHRLVDGTFKRERDREIEILRKER